MDLLTGLWRRALTRHVPPEPAEMLGLAGAALVLVVVAWPLARMLVTVCHEAGHAVIASLTGRRLTGIRLHSDTSGLTLSKGRPTGPGMVAMTFAGYPAASLVGLGVAAGAGAGYAAGVLWGAVAVLALMLVKIRNPYGALVVVALGAALGVTSWYAEPRLLTWIAHGLAWLLLLAGPRPVLELAARRRRRSEARSDAAQLARLTRVPQLGWIGLWLAVTLGSLGLGICLMLPGVLSP